MSVNNRVARIAVNLLLGIVCLISVFAFVDDLQPSGDRLRNIVEGISSILGAVGLLLYFNERAAFGLVGIGMSVLGSVASILLLHGIAYRHFSFWVSVVALAYLTYGEIRANKFRRAVETPTIADRTKALNRKLDSQYTEPLHRPRGTDYRRLLLLARSTFLKGDEASSLETYKQLLAIFRVPRRHQNWFAARFVMNQSLWGERQYNIIADRAAQLIPLTTDIDLRGRLQWWFWYALFYSERYEEMLRAVEGVVSARLSPAQQRVVGRAMCCAFNQLGQHANAVTEIERVLPIVAKKDEVVELLKYKCESLAKLERVDELRDTCNHLHVLGVDDEFVRYYQEQSGRSAEDGRQ